MSAHRACLACRARKVKCVPGPRRCVRCTNMGIQDCAYDHIKKRGIGKTLRMGQACTYCRIKKKKCDAKRPCETCIQAKRVSECIYDDDRGPYPAGVHLTYSTGSHLPERQLGDAAPVEISTPAPIDIDATDELSALQRVPHSHSSGLILVRGNSPELRISPDTISPIDITSFLPPIISPEPWISFLAPEKLQVQISDDDVSDLDMRSRLWLMIRLLKFGTHLGGKKMDALLRGDQSNAVLDRAFVRGSHVLGMMALASDTPAMVRLHARRVQMAWEALAELFEKSDYGTRVQAAILVVSSHVYMCMPQMAQLYIQKICDFMKAGELQFVPPCGRPPEFSEELHENLGALSQAIYWANYLFLMCGGPEPRTTAKLEKEFRQELQQTYPILFEICPLTMRTRGILLVRDTIMLLGFRTADSVRLEFWQQSCDQLLTSLEEFSQKLLGDIKTFRERNDKCGAEVLGSSCIACLAHLAMLYEVVGRTSPVARPEMYNLCDSALQRLGTLTSELRFDEYTYLDLLLGDSWRKSLPVFDVRIGSLPFEASGSLRHFRKLVEETYSDFHAGLPDYEPPMLYSLALMEDGTSEESKYPNLMSPEVRMQFGI